jgi:two-component system NtrC family sensor kinase
MRVLVIDDDERMLRCIERTMSRDGCEVVTAGSAREAFTLLAGNRFDAIICDLHLGDLRGATFFEKLSPPDAQKVVFITGGACDDADVEFLAKRRVVYKPFGAAELLDAVVQAAE